MNLNRQSFASAVVVNDLTVDVGLAGGEIWFAVTIADLNAAVVLATLAYVVAVVVTVRLLVSVVDRCNSVALSDL